MLAILKITTKKLKKISIITKILPEMKIDTISPYPTEEKVIKLKYINSKNCEKNVPLRNAGDLKFSGFQNKLRLIIC